MAVTHNVYAPVPGVPPVLVENANTITRRIPLHLLFDPDHPMRHDMEDDGLVGLAHSIREIGLLNDLCVIPIANGLRVRIEKLYPASLEAHERNGGTYQVRAGHRRLIACRSINLESVQCKVFCDPATSELAIMAHENSYREEPTDYDLAVMYNEWLKEPGLTEAELCRRAGRSPEFVYARADLLHGWEFVAMALKDRKINFAVARVLNREVDENYAKMFLGMATDQGATAKLVNAWVQEHKAIKDMTPQGGAAPDVGAPVVVAAPGPVECIACGERQSYNLRTVLLCVSDATAIKRLREEMEAAKAAAQPGT